MAIDDRKTLNELRAIQRKVGRAILVPSVHRNIRRGDESPHIVDTARIFISKSKKTAKTTLIVGNRQMFYGRIIDTLFFQWRAKVINEAAHEYHRQVDIEARKILKRIGKGLGRG